jgi:hypothetical protein
MSEHEWEHSRTGTANVGNGLLHCNIRLRSAANAAKARSDAAMQPNR